MKNRGFTLIEIMVVFTVFSIIIGAIYAVFTVGNQSWLQGAAQVDVQQEARRAMDWMIRELRESRDSGITIASGGSSITFEIPSNLGSTDIIWDYQVQYFLSGAQLMRTLSDKSTGVPIAIDVNRVLANDVNNLQFTRIQTTITIADPDGVPNSGDEEVETLTALEVNLQTQKDVLQGRTMQNALTSRAILRNE